MHQRRLGLAIALIMGFAALGVAFRLGVLHVATPRWHWRWTDACAEDAETLGRYQSVPWTGTVAVLDTCRGVVYAVVESERPDGESVATMRRLDLVRGTNTPVRLPTREEVPEGAKRSTTAASAGTNGRRDSLPTVEELLTGRKTGRPAVTDR